MSDMNKNNYYPDFVLNKRRVIDKYSPCIRNCCLDEDDICLGCFRSVDEIMQWSGSSDEEKKVILSKADIRKKKRQNKTII